MPERNLWTERQRRGWPFNLPPGHVRPHHIEPIVKNATFAVFCKCGFAHDSAAATAEAAIEEVRATHDYRCTEYEAIPY